MSKVIIPNNLTNVIPSINEASYYYNKANTFAVTYELNDTIQNYGTASDSEKNGVIIDVETTGLEDDDEIIEICCLPFTFNASGDVTNMGEPFVTRGAPKNKTVNKFISDLTGIMPDDLIGLELDLKMVHQMIKYSDVVIAHNAGFDRRMLENTFDNNDFEWPRSLWLCSSNDFNWRESGILSNKLDYIAYKLGFFFEHHRADIDCKATLHVISHNTENGSILKNMFKGFLPHYMMMAKKSPFETKGILKERGYSWNVQRKTWEKPIPKDEMNEEKEWLENEIYNGMEEYEYFQIDPYMRYSNQ